MKTKLLLISTLTFFSFSSNASLKSLDFVNCFEKAVNETIVEIKESGEAPKNICDKLSIENKDLYISKFTEIRNGELVQYSAKDMASTKVIDLYDYMKDKMSCFAYKGDTASVVGSIRNSGSYHNNMDLVQSAMNKMISAEMWDKFFSPSAYKKLGEFDLSFCEK